MKDSHGRNIDYMRISITDRCNLRCKYCMPEDLPSIPHEKILRFEEILHLCRLAGELGIRKFKVTGGEPLVRKNCLEFLKNLKELPTTEQVTLTTNGTLLSEYLPELKRIGLDGINISLDTLNEHTFEQITGRAEFSKVMDAIISCQACGIRTKVNSVLLQNINSNDFFDLVHLAETYPIDVRFIEIMPIGFGQQFKGLNHQELLAILSKQYPDHVQVHEHRGNGPATYIYLPGFKGCIGFIDAIHGKFCSSCNRVRLTADGILKLCLYYQNGIDLKSMLHAGYPDSLIRTAMEQAIFRKPSEHQFHLTALEGPAEQRRMSQIGG